MSAERSSLRDVQARFYSLVTAPQGVALGLTQESLTSQDLESDICGDERLSATERLDVYANMYFFRILDVLRDDYPRLLAVVGDGEFHNLVTDYLLACRPASFTLRNVGSRLSGFLAAHRLSADQPWLADLAQLERQRIEVFDAADSEALSLLDLQTIAPEAFADLRVQLITAHTTFEAGYAIEPVWSNRASADEQPSPVAEPHTVLVWRQDPMVYQRPLDALETALYSSLRRGVAFGLLCEQISELRPDRDVAQLAFELLGRLVNDGLLAAGQIM